MSKSPVIIEYHAHIYFHESMTKSAEALYDKIGETFGDRIKRNPIAYGPRGPHDLNMFGLDIPKVELEAALDFLILRRGGHSVLVHPVTDNELMDHTQFAMWLGDKQPLNLSVLV